MGQGEYKIRPYTRFRASSDLVHEKEPYSFITLTLALSHPGNGIKLSHQSFPVFGKTEAVGGGAFAAREAPPAAMMRRRGLHKMLNGS